MFVNNIIRRAAIVVVMMTAMAASVFAQDASLLLSEDFSGFVSGTSTNIATSLDSYTHVPGWSGLQLYGVGSEGGAVKIATSSLDGMIITPRLQGKTGTISICVEAKSYSRKNNYFVAYIVGLVDANPLIKPEGTLYVADFDITTDYQYYVVNISYKGNCRVRLDPASSAYISSLKVYDGIVTLEDMTAGISNRTVKSDDVIHNINGVALDKSFGELPKGIYLLNGRKIIKR